MFSIDLVGLGIALGLLGIVFFFKKQKESEPRIFWPNLADLRSQNYTLKQRLFPLGRLFFKMAILSFLLALIDPSLKLVKSQEPQHRFLPQEGIVMYLALDRSGSMREKVSPLTKGGESGLISKLDLLKQIAKDFIEGRPNDLIGLVSFARAPTVLSPPTMDHRLLLQKLAALDFVKDKNQDGTAIGYAIYKTSHLIASIKSFFQKRGENLKSPVLILVTDGLQDPNPLDSGNNYRAMELEEASAYAKEQSIKLYIINMDPNFLKEKYAPNLRELKRVAEKTDGQFFMVDSSHSLKTIFNAINQLEKSKINIQVPNESYQKYSFSPYLIGLGLFFLSACILLRRALLRVLP